MSILRSTKTGPIYQPPGVDWGNPVTRGLIVATPATTPPRLVDAVSGRFVSTSSVLPVAEPIPNGMSLRSGLVLGTPTFLTDTARYSSAPFSLLLDYSPATVTDATQKGLWTFGNSSGEGSPRLYIAQINGDLRAWFGGAYRVTASGFLQLRRRYVIIFTHDGTTGTLYANGVVLGSFTGAMTTGNATNWYLGAGFGGAVEGNFLSHCQWSRGLTQSEVISLSVNPSQVFGQDRRLRPFEAGAAGTHDATGALSNAGGSLSGTASSATSRTATGALSGAGATTSGTAARTRVHPSSGVLANPGGQLTGSAARAAAGNHPSVGVLSNPGAVTTGTATRVGNRPSSGVLQGAGGQLSGSANRVAAPVTHVATGVLANPGASLVGFAINESGAIVDTHDGFWFREQRKMWEWARKKKPTIEEVVEYVEDEPEEALEIAKQVAPVAVSRIDTTELRNNTQAAEFVAQQLMVAIELRRVQVEREADEDDIESILLLM